MVWQIDVSERAEKQLAQLDRPVAKRIYDFMTKRVAALDDPRSIGQPLRGSVFGEFWKYRVGNWRVICTINDHKILITVVILGNRRDIYR